jgi:hypothetical protein
MPGDTDADTDALQEQIGRKRRQLRAIASKSSDTAGGSSGKRLFRRGNRFGALKGKKARSPIGEIDEIARETVRRLRRREFTEVVDAEGVRKRVEKPLEPAKATAITNALRLRLDIFREFEAAEELARLREESERQLAMIQTLKGRVVG